MLPEGWKKVKIDTICTLLNGHSFKPKDWSDSGLPIIRIQNLNGSRDYNYYSGIPEKKWIVNTGDLLFAWAGTKGVSFGPCIWSGGKGVLNQHIYKVNHHNGVNLNWLFLILRTVTSEIEKKAHGFKKTLLHVQKKDITEQFIYLPPFSEQEKIAAILSTWDKAISTADAMLENSRQQKKALMQQLLTGKRRLPGFKGEWCFLQAKKLFNSISIKHRPEEQLLAVTQDDGVVPRALLDRRVVMPEGDVDNYKFVKKGDFIISLRSFQGGIEYSNYNGLVSPAYTIIEKRCDIDDAFYRHYFKSSLFIGKLAIAVIGIRDGKQISYDDFAGIPLPVPPLDEQRAIAAVLDAADREIALLEQKAARLREEKKALMQQLLTGKRRVQV